MFGDLPIFLLTQDHMGLEISKCYFSTDLNQFEPQFTINEAVITEYKVTNVLAICQKIRIKNFVAL